MAKVPVTLQSVCNLINNKRTLLHDEFLRISLSLAPVLAININVIMTNKLQK